MCQQSFPRYIPNNVHPLTQKFSPPLAMLGASGSVADHNNGTSNYKYTPFVYMQDTSTKFGLSTNGLIVNGIASLISRQGW